MKLHQPEYLRALRHPISIFSSFFLSLYSSNFFITFIILNPDPLPLLHGYIPPIPLFFTLILVLFKFLLHPFLGSFYSLSTSLFNSSSYTPSFSTSLTFLTSLSCPSCPSPLPIFLPSSTLSPLPSSLYIYYPSSS